MSGFVREGYVSELDRFDSRGIAIGGEAVVGDRVSHSQQHFVGVADFYVFVEEHPDSINDGFFVESWDEVKWNNLPASYHNGSANLHFCKVFKKSTGLKFTDYVARVRLEDAKTQLLNPSRRISEVAYDVGFQSPNVEAAKPMVYVTTLLLLAIVVIASSTAIYLRNRMRSKYTTSTF